MATLATATCIGAGSKLITTSEAYGRGRIGRFGENSSSTESILLRVMLLLLLLVGWLVGWLVVGSWLLVDLLKVNVLLGR